MAQLGNIDLALECSEARGCPKGMTVDSETRDGLKITTIAVTTPEAAQRLGKPVGRYITLEMAGPPDEETLEKQSAVLAERLRELLPAGELLVCGLGNRSITPDALGPLAAERVLATRHLPKDEPGLEDLRPVSVLAAGVLSQTGIETAEIIRSLTAQLHPAAVVTVDALAARRLSRLAATVQISDSGIAPGSGVGNSRSALNAETLGCPVISVGVPLVVDGLTLACDASGAPPTEREAVGRRLPPGMVALMVTPQDIDKTVRSFAALIARALNLAAQPSLDAETLDALIA